MSGGWYVIRAELRSVGGEDCVPPPGRDLLVSPTHTFRRLADVINAGFARWDLGHAYAFRMADGTEIGTALEDSEIRDAARDKIGARDVGEIFEFEFDFGDSWIHACIVREAGVDPIELYGETPSGPIAVFGWGIIPDQYGRMTPDD